MFMWLYMVSLYMETPSDTRRKRLPYLGASLFILLLFTTASIIDGIKIYHLLFESSPGAENARAAITLFLKHAKSPRSAAVGLIADWSLRFADLVLVSTYRILCTSILVLTTLALSLLHHLVYPPLGDNFAALCLDCRRRYVYISPSYTLRQLKGLSIYC